MSYLGNMSRIAHGIKKLNTAIGRFLNAAILTVVYFAGIGIPAIIAKLFRKHFLDLKTSNRIQTYWSDLNVGDEPRDEYYRQF